MIIDIDQRTHIYKNKDNARQSPVHLDLWCAHAWDNGGFVHDESVVGVVGIAHSACCINVEILWALASASSGASDAAYEAVALHYACLQGACQ